MFTYVESFAFLADGSVRNLDTVVQDDSVGVQVDDMAVKIMSWGEVRMSVRSGGVVCL
jgi:acetyl/propionyl-CoA carboxylase alpha subunit